MMKIGLMGCGRIARVHFHPSWMAVAVVTVFLASVSLASAQEWQVVMNSRESGVVGAVGATGDVIVVGARIQAVLTIPDNDDSLDVFDQDALVVKRSGVDGHQIWRHTFDGTAPHALFAPGIYSDAEEATAAAVDHAGDVIVAGVLTNADTRRDFFVAKLAGIDGHEIWRREFDGTSPDGLSSDGDDITEGAIAVQVDSIGNVIAAGHLTNADTYRDVFVVKLAGTDGREIWRQTLNSIPDDRDNVYAATLDNDGNVVVAGIFSNAGNHDFTVAKLSGVDGDELWRKTINAGLAGGAANAVTVDSNGDVVAAGFLGEDRGNVYSSPEKFFVIKLAKDNGDEVWRVEISERDFYPEAASAVTVDRAGDVIAVGSVANRVRSDGDFSVVKLRGMDGAEVWRTQLNGSANAIDEATAVATDSAGDVVASGMLVNEGSQRDVTVVKLAAANGHELWRKVFSGEGDGPDSGGKTVMDGNGDVITGAQLFNLDYTRSTLLAKLDGTTGGNHALLAGAHLLVRQKAGASSVDRMIVSSKDLLTTTGIPGSTADPTLHGATLTLVNPATHETTTLVLPATKWTGLGSPAGSAGYKYNDSAAQEGPCRNVMLQRGKPLQVTCTGAGLTFTLDEAAQGALGVRLTTGYVQQCLLFGGTVLKDSTAGGKTSGVFQARNAPAPAVCP